MNFKVKISIVCFFICAYSHIFCQYTSALVKTLNTGNPKDNPINGFVFFDKNDVLWIGTQYGVSYFDGTRYERLDLGQNMKRIFTMFQDSTKRIFVRLEDLGLYEVGINVCGPFIEKVYEKNFGENELKNELISKILKITPETKESPSYIMNILKPSEGMRYYTIGDNVIYSSDNQTKRLLRKSGGGHYLENVIFDDKNLASNIDFTYAPKVYAKGKDFLLDKNKVYKMKYENGKVYLFSYISDLGFSLEDVKATYVAYNDNTNTFAISTINQGILLVTPSNFKLINNHISNNRLRNVFYNISHYPKNSGLIVGNSYILNYEYKKIRDLSSSPDLFGYTTQKPGGNIFYRYANTLLEENSKGLKVASYDLGSDNAYGLEFGFCESDSLCYFSNIKFVFRLKNNIFEKIINIDSYDSGLKSIRQIFRYKGQLWALTDKGIAVLDDRNNTLSPLNGSPNVYFRNVFPSKDGKILWFCSENGGLHFLKDNKWYKVQSDRLGFLDFPHAVLNDGKGFLWISTNYGLIQVKEDVLVNNTVNNIKNATYFHYYSKFDGLLTDEFNGGTQSNAIVLGDSLMFFASMNGLVAIKPDYYNQTLSPSPILLNKLTVDGVTMPYNGNLVFNSKHASLNIELVNPYYGNPLNNLLEYKLIGEDLNWNRVPNTNSISLGRLAPGDYTLRIRKRSGFENDEFEYLNFYLTIEPLFYETIWAKLLIILLLLLLVFGYVSYRSKKLIKENKKLMETIEEKVALLTQEKQNALINLKLALENETKLLNYKKEMVTMVSHDIISPLSAVHQAVQILDNELKATPSSNLAILSDVILKACEKTIYLGNQLRQSFSISGHSQPDSTTFDDLILFIKKLFGVNFYLSKVNVTYRNDAEVNLLDKDIYESLEIILRNIVSNILKHGQPSKIEFICQYDGSIDVIEYGQILTESKINFINDRIYGASLLEDNPGLGLGLIKTHLNMIGYKLKISTNDLGNIYHIAK